VTSSSSFILQVEINILRRSVHLVGFIWKKKKKMKMSVNSEPQFQQFHLSDYDQSIAITYGTLRLAPNHHFINYKCLCGQQLYCITRQKLCGPALTPMHRNWQWCSFGAMRFSKQSKTPHKCSSYQLQVTTYQRHFILSNRHAVMFMETKPPRLRSTG